MSEAVEMFIGSIGPKCLWSGAFRLSSFAERKSLASEVRGIILFHSLNFICELFGDPIAGCYAARFLK